MNAQVRGFSLLVHSPKYDRTAFLKDLRGIAGQERTVRGRRMTIHLREDGKLLRGLVFLPRSQRGFVVHDTNDNSMRVHSLAKNLKMGEVNFFVIDTGTWRGVYQSYHESMSVIGFTGSLEQLYKELREKRMDDEVADVPDVWGSKSTIRRIRSEYRQSRLEAPIHLRQDQLEALLKELSRIERVELTISTIKIKEPWFRRFVDRTKTARIGVSFAREFSVDTLIPDILNMVKESAAIRGRVAGTDKADQPRSFSIDQLQNYAIFNEVSMDELLKMVGSLSFKNFQKAKVFDWLIEVGRKEDMLVSDGA